MIIILIGCLYIAKNKMAKKKKYLPPDNDKWNYEEDKEHRRIIKEKEKYIREKYKKWWDKESNSWKEGGPQHGGP